MLYASTSPQSTSSSSGVAYARRGAQGMVLAFVTNAVLATPVKLVAAVAERRRVARAIAQLEALSDHVLADIGIDRGDIPRVVRCGRD
jgi:uncharacterized protein YjiS (DUF1127 family)